MTYIFNVLTPIFCVSPNITRKKPAPPDADAFVKVPDKFAKYFSPNPGEGD